MIFLWYGLLGPLILNELLKDRLSIIEERKNIKKNTLFQTFAHPKLMHTYPRVRHTYPNQRRPYPKLWRQLAIGAQKLNVNAHKFREGYIYIFLYLQIFRFLRILTTKSDKTNCILIATSKPFELYIHV